MCLLCLRCDCYSLSNENDSLRTVITRQEVHFKVRIGDTVRLPCKIENRKGATVLWQFSKGNLPETLTIGILQYRPDYRIRVITNSTNESNDDTESWDLEIRKIRYQDEGSYTCRVMTNKETLKRVVHLKVEANLSLKPEDEFIVLGNSYSLFCNTSLQYKDRRRTRNRQNVIKNDLHINWFLNGNKIKSNDSSFKIEHFNKPYLSSKLTILNADYSHSGMFICKFRSQNVSTHLNVIKGMNTKH